MTLSPPISRLAAVGLCAILLGGLWIAIAEPLVTSARSRDRAILETRDLLARTQRSAAVVPELEARRDTLNAAIEDGSGFLQGETPEVVAAALQERLKALIGREGGLLKSTQALEPGEQAGFRRVALRVSMVADTPSLQRIFYRLESGRPSLFLDKLEIRAAARAARRGSRDDGEALQVRFDLFGYLGRTAP